MRGEQLEQLCRVLRALVEHARLRLRGESLCVIQAACAEAQCAQRRGRTRPRAPPESLLEIAKARFVCLHFKRWGVYRQATQKKGKFALLVWKPASYLSHTNLYITRARTPPFFLCPCMNSVCEAPYTTTVCYQPDISVIYQRLTDKALSALYQG